MYGRQRGLKAPVSDRDDPFLAIHVLPGARRHGLVGERGSVPADPLGGRGAEGLRRRLHPT